MNQHHFSEGRGFGYSFTTINGITIMGSGEYHGSQLYVGRGYDNGHIRNNSVIPPIVIRF